MPFSLVQFLFQSSHFPKLIINCLNPFFKYANTIAPRFSIIIVWSLKFLAHECIYLYFNLFSSSFQEIHPDAFRDLKIMVELDLSHNNITQIKPDTFSGNERLQTLTLAHNFISQLSPYQVGFSFLY